MLRTLAWSVGLALASALAAAPPQGRRNAAPPALVPFQGTYEQALQRGYERNVPVLFVALAEGDGGAVDEDVAAFRAGLSANAEFLAAAQYAVVALGANKPHEQVEVELDERGKKVKHKLCSLYRTEGCTAHQKLFDEVYREHNVEGELRSPAVHVFGPDRAKAQSWQTGHVPTWAELVGALDAVRKKAGEGLTEAQFAEVTALCARGAAEMQASQWGAAHDTWQGVLVITQKTRQAALAREQMAKAYEGLVTLRDEGRAWIAAGKLLEGYRRFVELQPHVADTPLEKELAREIRALEVGKATKDAIAAYKRELEADKLWNEAEALEGKAREGKLRLLLRKYGDTPAGKRARERYPELAADEDAKKKGGDGA